MVHTFERVFAFTHAVFKCMSFCVRIHNNSHAELIGCRIERITVRQGLRQRKREGERSGKRVCGGVLLRCSGCNRRFLSLTIRISRRAVYLHNSCAAENQYQTSCSRSVSSPGGRFAHRRFIQRIMQALLEVRRRIDVLHQTVVLIHRNHTPPSVSL